MSKPFSKHLSVISLFIAIVVTGCFDNNPVTPSINLDPNLIGTWYKIDTSSNYPSSYSVSGIYFSPIGGAYFIGVETETGNLGIIKPYDSLLQASDGVIVLRDKISRWYHYDTLFYSINNNVLTYKSNRQEVNQNGNYIRGQLGEHIIPPVKSDFSIVINGKIFQNKKISNNASAYVQDFGNQFLIVATLNENWAINISEQQILKTGSFYINNEYGNNRIWFFHKIDEETGIEYGADLIYTGKLEIISINEKAKTIQGIITANLKYVATMWINKIAKRDYFLNKTNTDTTSIKIYGIFTLPIY